MDDSGRVVHMTELPKGKCKVKDILKLAQPFGIITKYLFLNTKHEVSKVHLALLAEKCCESD